MNDNRTVLKQILSGALTPDQAASILRNTTGLYAIAMWHETTGLYTYNDEKNLTLQQLEERTKGLNLSIIRILHCEHPIAYSENDIIL